MIFTSCIFQFALVHYFTKVGAGEYYLEELEETICMAEEKLKQKRNGGNTNTHGNNAQDSVSYSILKITLVYVV